MVNCVSYLFLRMNKKCFLLQLTLFLTVLSMAQSLPKEKQVLKTLRLTNQYFMSKWPDAGKETVTNKVRPSNLWTRAVYYEGLVGLYQVDPQQPYKDYMLKSSN